MSGNRNVFPDPPAVSGRLLDAQLDLLDRQVLDPDALPVNTVDDIELSDPPESGRLDPADPPQLTALLSGPVFATRVFGGRPPDSRFIRIPWRVVGAVEVVIQVSVRADTLDASWVERWLRDHVIAHIPGGRHDPE